MRPYLTAARIGKTLSLWWQVQQFGVELLGSVVMNTKRMNEDKGKVGTKDSRQECPNRPSKERQGRVKATRAGMAR